jgi:hypothetical protein
MPLSDLHHLLNGHVQLANKNWIKKILRTVQQNYCDLIA